MKTIKATINIEIDGQQLDGYPFVKLLTVDELQQFEYEKTSGAGFVSLPIGELGNIQLLLFRPNKEVTLRLDGQTTAGIVVAANGIVLITGATIDVGASTNAMVENTSGSDAILRGLAGGT